MIRALGQRFRTAKTIFLSASTAPRAACHAIGLNDICDALRLYSRPLSSLRGATPPSRNNLSHANKRRDAALAERLFWAVLDHLQKLSPGFGIGRRGKGLARRFRRIIHVVG